MTSRSADRLILDAVRRGGPWLAGLAAAALVGAAAELALPAALAQAVDALVSGTPGGERRVILTALLVGVVVACDAVRVLAAGRAGARTALWLRRRAVVHVLSSGTALSRRLTPGEIVTRAGVNAEEVARTPEAVVTAAALLVPSAGSVIALALIDPSLAVTLVAGLVLIVAVLRAFIRRTTAASGGYQRAQGQIAARLVGALAGARTVAAAGTQDREARRVLAPLPRLREHGLDLWRLQARAGVRAAVVIPLLETAVLAVGGLRLAAGDLTVGELLAAARYVVLGAGLGSAIGYAARLARARSAAGRLDELLAAPAPAYGSRPLPDGPGRLELRGVTLDADGGPVLAGVDLIVPGGSCVAVVGRSGAGKSSLAAVAGRLADPDSGSVLLDGVPLREIDRRELRSAVGYAFERPVLFGETLGDAMGSGVPGQDGGRVRAAAAAACADGFVRRLPLGYATPIADAPMSGGEVQRIGLARAFAQAERLLILDDAMSSLDTVTERQVGRALTGGLADRTRLVVAHRAGTAARADQVVWLDEGRVRATGPHALLWRDPAYRAVFQGDS
ncbi:ABC transporter ATP-binding protein [Microbispora sp. RL4-1S]|uniref:ABC transporter ATP-binding protein n=1 Tax=Microbispora oryzae TaxID=2806554 RepID=A0A940WFA4_9ACTN|nr:ABC transporter ATP-binding protein [Microbispora oryzae]MBP2703613.1 ABC transporter ATP-binding protein [Microbispora oryzae]